MFVLIVVSYPYNLIHTAFLYVSVTLPFIVYPSHISEELPAWPGAGEQKKLRSVRSQKQYTEARLCPKGPSYKPGSVEELQAKLDAMRRERHAHETTAAVAAVS